MTDGVDNLNYSILIVLGLILAASFDQLTQIRVLFTRDV